MKRKIAIIDTGFDDGNDAIQKLWDGFSYEKLDLVASGPYHEHGTMVANFLMRPFDNDQMRGKVHFVHIRAGNASGGFLVGPIMDAFDAAAALQCDAVNCSWGGPGPTDATYQKMANRMLELMHGGTVLHLAAGNDGDKNPDDDVCFPQTLLSRGNGSYLWGAMSKSGVPASWTSDGEKVYGGMWAAKVKVHDPKGRIVLTNGSSFASPKACGMCEAWMAVGMFPTYKELEDHLWRSLVNLTQNDSGDWVPYMNENGEPWHPKCGRGSGEKQYQGLTFDARCRFDVTQQTPTAEWFNFRVLWK